MGVGTFIRGCRKGDQLGAPCYGEIGVPLLIAVTESIRDGDRRDNHCGRIKEGQTAQHKCQFHRCFPTYCSCTHGRAENLQMPLPQTADCMRVSPDEA